MSGHKAPGGDRTVLLLEDDVVVREITAAMFEDLGWTVIEADNGAAALDILRGPEAIDLMLADYTLPGMNGVEVAELAARLRPGLPILFVTGYSELHELHNVGEDRIILKPFRAEALARKVASIFGDDTISRLPR